MIADSGDHKQAIKAGLGGAFSATESRHCTAGPVAIATSWFCIAWTADAAIASDQVTACNAEVVAHLSLRPGLFTAATIVMNGRVAAAARGARALQQRHQQGGTPPTFSPGVLTATSS